MGRLNVDRTKLAQFCARHGIVRLSLFGSRASGTARPDSDIDLLVEFDPDRMPGMLALASMEHELSALLDGVTVDLRTAAELGRYFCDHVGRTAEVQYARTPGQWDDFFDAPGLDMPERRQPRHVD